MRAQTATEYLIITAVVLVIGGLVLQTLGGIPNLGFGASESVDILKLSSGEIGVKSFSASIAKTHLTIQNNRNALTLVTSITLNGTPCWIPGPKPGSDGLPRLIDPGQTVTLSCSSAVVASPSQSFAWNFSLNYTDVTTQAQYTIAYGIVRGVASGFACPTGFVPVAGMTLMDTRVIPDFCVMKYEAKAYNITAGAIDTDGYNGNSVTQWTGTALTNAVPRSDPTGQPWRNINHSDARAECQSLGADYDMISDPQWMAIVETIHRVPINNVNSSNPSYKYFSTGHTDNVPSDSVGTTSANDPIVSGCNLWLPLDNASNAFSATCQLRGNGTTQQFGYNGTGDNFTGGYGTTIGGRSQLRTHVLANGQVVWDMSGNAWDATRTLSTNTVAIGPDFYSPSGANFLSMLTYYPWIEPSTRGSFGTGYGYVFGIGTASKYFMRGGYRFNDANVGIFMLRADNSEATLISGFRCVYQPYG